MPYTFTKTVTTVTETTIKGVKLNFMSYQAFSNTRKDKPLCDHCDKPFKPEDQTHLAFVTKGLNQLLCQTCAEKALANGAEEVTFGTKS